MKPRKMNLHEASSHHHWYYQQIKVLNMQKNESLNLVFTSYVLISSLEMNHSV